MANKLLHEDFHEVWWIYAPEHHPWGGVRIAHFRMTVNGMLIFSISNEPPDRLGLRIWADAAPREGWVKVKQIPLPTKAEVELAMVPHKLTLVDQDDNTLEIDIRGNR